MGCCATQGCEYHFDETSAQKDLAQYQKHGPEKTTRLLLEALTAEGVNGRTLLDIGGGIGAVQHGLIQQGVTHVTGVDASAAYLATARKEAKTRGYADRATYHLGDLVSLSESLPDADVVTLDRVICCYEDVHALVAHSAAKARHLYGFVFPRANAFTRLAFRMENFKHRLQKNPFRAYIHDTGKVDTLLKQAGFERRYRTSTFFWQVMVYVRRTYRGPVTV